MYYTVYKTTNLINSKIYVGLHETDNLNDGYLGSGVFLKKAIKKYGYKKFKKEILFIFDNKEDMVKKEKELVNKKFIKRKDTYNMSKGGFGLCTLSNEVKAKAISRMKKTKQAQDLTIISKKRIKTMLSNDPDCFSKIAIKSSIKQKANYLKGYINPNQRLDDVIIYNQHHEIMYRCKRINLNDVCLNNNLPIRVLIKSIQNKGLPLYLSQPPRKKTYIKYKGWYAIYENEID